MNELFHVASNFAYIIEMLVACLVFSLPLKQRAYSILGFLFGAAISLMVGMALGSIIQPNIPLAVLTYLIQLAVVVLPVWMSCQVSFSDAVYATLCAYAMQHFASSCYILVRILTGLLDLSADWFNPATLVSYLVVYIVVYVSFYWMFARPLADHGEYRVNSLQSSSLTILVVPIALVLSLVVKLSSGEDNGFFYSQIYAMLCSAFVLWVQVSQRKAIYWQRELAAQEQLWQSQKEQYQISKEQIELINQKCHDLKHQIAALRTIHN